MVFIANCAPNPATAATSAGANSAAAELGHSCATNIAVPTRLSADSSLRLVTRVVWSVEQEGRASAAQAVNAAAVLRGLVTASLPVRATLSRVVARGDNRLRACGQRLVAPSALASSEVDPLVRTTIGSFKTNRQGR
jgi:hypothetical protein